MYWRVIPSFLKKKIPIVYCYKITIEFSVLPLNLIWAQGTIVDIRNARMHGLSWQQIFLKKICNNTINSYIVYDYFFLEQYCLWLLLDTNSSGKMSDMKIVVVICNAKLWWAKFLNFISGFRKLCASHEFTEEFLEMCDQSCLPIHIWNFCCFCFSPNVSLI